MTQDPHNTLNWGGEFTSSALEAAFLEFRQPEQLRHTRLTAWCCIIFNTLFLLTDCRFFGQPHFLYALLGRASIIFSSLLCLRLIDYALTPRRLHRLCAAWSLAIIFGAALLISSHSTIALFVIFLLPVIFYLVIPLPFAWTLGVGLGCSAATLSSYLASETSLWTGFGLSFALLTLNAILTLSLIQSNRLRRLQWAAIRAEQAANEQLEESRKMLQTLLRAVPTPLVIMAKDTGRLLQANAAAQSYFGEKFLSNPLSIGRLLDVKELARVAAAHASLEGLSETETRIFVPELGWRETLLVPATTQVQNSEAVLVTVVDITARKQMEADLLRLASTDSLTGLPNRACFFAQADEETKRAQRYNRPLSVLMIDMDHFKRINDAYGHVAGDAALRSFAQLCLSLLREHDCIGRLGGEEFAVVLPETTLTGAQTLAERLREEVAGMRVDPFALALTVSMGVSERRPDESTIEPALSRADQALYLAKREGRNSVRVYDEEAADAPRTVPSASS